MRAFAPPRDNERYRWTAHVARKMAHYRLTPARVMRIVRAPERVEAGVAPGTVAGMQRAGTKEKPAELWAMWREEKKGPGVREEGEAGRKTREAKSLPTPHPSTLISRKVIITAWRYPGASPVRDAVPIPSEVLAELEAEGFLDETGE